LQWFFEGTHIGRRKFRIPKGRNRNTPALPVEQHTTDVLEAARLAVDSQEEISRKGCGGKNLLWRFEAVARLRN
jgi:hypothetical protein